MLTTVSYNSAHLIIPEQSVKTGLKVKVSENVTLLLFKFSPQWLGIDSYKNCTKSSLFEEQEAGKHTKIECASKITCRYKVAWYFK